MTVSKRKVEGWIDDIVATRENREITATDAEAACYLAVFNTGQIVATRGVYDLACQNSDFARFMQESLNRHVKGDWGDAGMG